MARRGGFSDFIQAFNQGFDTVNKIGKDYEIAKLSAEKEAPVYNPDQVDQRATIAGAVDADGKALYTVDTAPDGQTRVQANTPTEDGTLPRPFSIAAQGTQYLGKNYAGPLSDADRASAKSMKMATILGKYGDAEGAARMQSDAVRMQREAKMESQGDQRFAWERGRVEREQSKAAKDDDYQTGRQEVFNGSVFGQKNAAFVKQHQTYVQEKKVYDDGLAAGKNPQEIGLPPQAPTRPAYSIADSLADQGALLSHDAKFGKVDARTFGEFTERMRKMEEEGYGKALTLAQGGASIDQVAEAFNSNGQVKFDPKAVVSDKMVQGAGGGAPERVISFRDAQGNMQTINVMSELKSLGKAGEVLNQFYAAETNRRGNNSDKRDGQRLALDGQRVGLAQRVADIELPVHQANAEVAKLKIELAKTDDPKIQAMLSDKIYALASGRRGAAMPHDDPNKLYQQYKAAALKANPYGSTAIEKANNQANKMMRDEGWARSGDGTWGRSGAGAAAGGTGPAKGAVVNGFEFQGGNPNDKANWKAVAK
jgi:hypothetical protein